MNWQRKEEGRFVTVTFKPISQLPKATADRMTGLWALTAVVTEGENVTAAFDPDDQHYVFFRWDRIYVERTPEGKRATGYWHINGHRPEVTMLSHQQGKPVENWKVSVTETELSMSGNSDTNKGTKRIYHRIHQFPE